MTHRVAMWSGPRNISTAMMRAWENRSDTVVVDEPFYACYLNATGIVHPMRAEIIASQSIDWRDVAEQLTQAPVDADIYYQKHMTHHMLEDVDLSWTGDLVHCFLIRDPRYVVRSYLQKRDSVTCDDIGVKRQYELYRTISEITGQNIPVLDARLTLLHPESALRALCDRLRVPFSTNMLSWPSGRRPSDGVWSSHWYQAVETSTGFQPYDEAPVELSAEDARVAHDSMLYYEKLLDLCDRPQST